MRASMKIAGLVLLAQFLDMTHAVADSKGAELFVSYQAYRCDVEVAIEQALANNNNEEKPWNLARDCNPLPQDFADDKLPPANDPNTGKANPKGCNLHGFIRYIARDVWKDASRLEGFEKVRDQWNPTLDELKEVHYWGRTTTDPKDYQFTSQSTKKLLGRVVPTVPDSEIGKETTFYNTQKAIVALAGKRAETHPGVAFAYLEKIKDGLLKAGQARLIEGDAFTIDFWKSTITREISPEAEKQTKIKSLGPHPKFPEFGTWDRLDTTASLKAYETSLKPTELKKYNEKFLPAFLNKWQLQKDQDWVITNDSHKRQLETIIGLHRRVKAWLSSTTVPPNPKFPAQTFDGCAV